MDTNFNSPTSRERMHPYRTCAAPRAAPSRAGDGTLTGLIFGVTCLLFGFSVLRVLWGIHGEGWVFERWVALAFAVGLGRGLWRGASRVR